MQVHKIMAVNGQTHSSKVWNEDWNELSFCALWNTIRKLLLEVATTILVYKELDEHTIAC